MSIKAKKKDLLIFYGVNNLMDSKKVSVVIPTFNRLPYLKKCIDSLLASDFEDFEIIIVNDSSTDGTREYLNSFRNQNIKIVHNKENLGKSKSRNQGIKISSGDIIAFTDDDCVVDNDWIKNLIKEFGDGNTGFVIGGVFYVSRSLKAHFPERIVQNKKAVWPMTCNMAYRKKVLDKIGYFNAKYDDYNNEDTELALRAIDQGEYCNRAKDAVVFHQQSFWSVKSLLRSARNAAAWPLLKKEYPDNYSFFGGPVKFGIVVSPIDYFYILFFPVILPIILGRYLFHGKKDLKIFFAKWPVYFILKRYHIWKEAIKNKILMI